jgi:hypothetical protein
MVVAGTADVGVQDRCAIRGERRPAVAVPRSSVFTGGGGAMTSATLLPRSASTGYLLRTRLLRLQALQ